MQNNPMKAQHFLQISSAIIGKHRHRSGVTVNKDINYPLNRRLLDRLVRTLTNHTPYSIRLR